MNAALPYQVIFVPDGAKKTYQQLADDGEKAPFAFRTKAFQEFLEWFNKK
jgi:inosine/xanthosine triphosphate pyrophosphatase family protein